jgi:hypothetical protein
MSVIRFGHLVLLNFDSVARQNHREITHRISSKQNFETNEYKIKS